MSKVRVLTAPEQLTEIEQITSPKIFLAGGITNCPNWQHGLITNLTSKFERDGKSDLLLINPRRENFPIHDPTASTTQIAWEYHWLSESDAVVFWFSRGSDNPIVLFEYGNFGFSKLSFVGIDLEYSRRRDVEIQTALRKPYHRKFYNSLDAMVNDIFEYAGQR